VGVSQLIEFAASLFDAAGQRGEALNEIDHGLAIAGDNPDVKVMLHGMRASLLAGLGRTKEAAMDLAEVRAHCTAAQHPFVRFHGDVDHVAVACRLLSEVDEAEAGRLLATATNGEADILFLLSWFVPYLFATGAAKRTHPWTRTLRVKAELVPHPWREADAMAFEIAESAARGAWSDEEPPALHSNWLAEWRLAVLALHAAVTRRSLSRVSGLLDGVAATLGRAGGMDLGGIEPFRACAESAADPSSATVTLEPPASVHLGNLPAVLAGAQAVATGGSPALAARWLDWSRSEIPVHIVTSCEWPVSVHRLQGGLAARAGDFRAARRYYDRAITWSKETGYPVEQGIAEVQAGETGAHGGILVHPSVWRATRSAGWQRLQELGIDPLPFAYEVPSALVVARSDRTPTALTPRELEVLAALAQGLSYRAVGDALGIRTPTVQTLAHRVYEKLDARGRHAAVQAAKALGIL
jgi:DNA-binding CsgD family transcriptional regulator